MALWRVYRRLSATKSTLGMMAVLALLTSTSRLSAAQTIRVGLDVTESTGGLFQSAFGSAMRALQDIRIVTLAEHPAVILRVVVLCNPDDSRCEAATTYSVAVELVSPLDSTNIAAAINLANIRISPALRLSERQQEALVAQLRTSMTVYEDYGTSWAATWGRQAYVRASGELVAEVDSKCFERLRIHRRILDLRASGDTATASALVDRWLDLSGKEHWICS